MTTAKKSSNGGRRGKASSARSRRLNAAGRSAKCAAAHDVVAALLAEHRHAARLLDVLEQQLGLVAHGRPLDREAAVGVMSYMTEYPDAYHHPREDAMFVRLLQHAPALQKRIAQIERQHRAIGRSGRDLLAALQRQGRRRADEAELAQRIGDYVGAMREHMAIEERELFAPARHLLDHDDLAAIDSAFRSVTDPVFEASVRNAYAAYPALVRSLVEQPAVRNFLDLLDGVYASAATFGEVLFGGLPTRTAARTPRAGGLATGRSSSLRDGVDRRAP